MIRAWIVNDILQKIMDTISYRCSIAKVLISFVMFCTYAVMTVKAGRQCVVMTAHVFIKTTQAQLFIRSAVPVYKTYSVNEFMISR